MSDAAAPAPTPIVELLGVSKAFASPGAGLLGAAGPPVQALRDVALTIARGEALGIAGPNGAGKTTLLKLVAALIHPTTGQVRVDGLDTIAHGARLRPRVGFVPAQERTLYGRLTLRQNLHFFAAIKGLDSTAATRRIDELADRVGLLPALDRRANAVSSGFLQRCAIARALLAEPDLLLMDEPTRSLDEATAASVRAFVRDEHVRRLGRTLLVATHQVRDLGEMCDRVVEIEAGRLVGGSDSPAGHASKRVTELVRVVALDPAARAWPADAPLGIAGLRSRVLPAGEVEFTHAQRMGDAKLHELLTALLGAGMKVVTVETRRDLPAGGVGEARTP
jgi:ABC-type multidrug transport system ATPase subunit